MFAVSAGALPKLGLVAAACLAGVVIIAQRARIRALAMLGALVLAPVLLLDEIWSSPQVTTLHRHALVVAVGGLVALAAVGLVAWLFARRPQWIAPVAVAALPFRIPIQSGGSASNLLVPLYFVVAAAALSWIVPVLYRSASSRRSERRRPPHRFEQCLALVVVLYAVQATYSPGFEKALQNVVFFYVPFALLFALLRDLDWDQPMQTRCLVVAGVEAVIFALSGYAEDITHTVFLNPKLVAANDLHAYFTVNSVFFDPDIFGRFLALVMILLVAVLVYDKRRPKVLASAGVLAVLWGGLVLTLSRSSLGALLVGMAILAAMRWRRTRTVLAVGVALLAIGGIVVAITPRTFGLNQGLNGASSGRANLVSGGVSMFGSEPLLGYGSGDFTNEYQKRDPQAAAVVSASHTIPVTIGAEQGLIGLLPYVALVLSALVVLFRSARGDPARAAMAAAFAALILHTLLYADFLEDPVTWTLLGVGSAFTARHADEEERAKRNKRQERRAYWEKALAG
ncbi:MAG: O-antigen ligase family protein [Solirubrobacterales bacterium]|nr:O-antigen ligase family protein [Solirubrobacterales bacterium]